MQKSVGFGLLEVVIASAVISMTIFSLSYVFVISQRLEIGASDKIRANFIAEEGLEAVRFLRDKSWDANIAPLSTANTYYLFFATSTVAWSLTATKQVEIDAIFDRKITIENVMRDGSDDIVASGGTLDPDTKKINVQVLWQKRGATSTLTLSTYLTNIFDN